MRSADELECLFTKTLPDVFQIDLLHTPDELLIGYVTFEMKTQLSLFSFLSESTV